VPERSPSRTVLRILEVATRVVADRGLQATTLADVARAAGVPFGLLRYHFRSKDHLLIEAQRLAFRRIHERFEERFAAGDKGVRTALEVLDALYGSVREAAPLTPFMLQAMAAATRDVPLGERLHDFNAEALTRVELGLLRVFADELHRLALPPERLSRAVRTGLYGLVVELALAKDEAELAAVDQTYRDVRGLLEAVLLAPETTLRSLH
jgi:AcrR family transcriptional regulator